jgi:uncharacterized protein
MHVPLHSLPFVGALFLLITALALNVSRLRRSYGIYLGDGGEKRLGRAVRAHGNALEHGLLFAVALVLSEVAGLPTPWVLGLGWTICAARAAHAAGFLRLGKQVVLAGVVVSYVSEVGLGWYLFMRAFR